MSDINSVIHFEPILSVYPNKSSLTFQPVGGWRGRRKVSDESKNNLKRRETAGLISKTVAKDMSNKIGWFHLFSKNKNVKEGSKTASYDFKLNMVTLTLPSLQLHCDKVIKRECLNRFLIVAKRKWGVSNYIWRAETQANGNIHFHIICDRFIPHWELRDNWNLIINKLDYVNNSMNCKNPNSTDIHSLKNVRNIGAYMSKYVSKNQVGRRLIVGALWGCSDQLRSLKCVSISCAGSIMDAIAEKVDTGVFKSFIKEKVYLVQEPVTRLMREIRGVREKVVDYYNEKIRGIIKKSCQIIESDLCQSLPKSLPNMALKQLSLSL